VPAAPDAPREVRAPFRERLVERHVGDQERVFPPGVVPDGDVAECGGVRADRSDHVVAREVLGVVEGAGGGVGDAQPEGGGVAANRAEAPGELESEVIGSEAVHRYAADGDPAGIGAGPPRDGGYRLVEHVFAPAAVGAVVPVAVVASLRQRDDGGAPTERRERLVKRFVFRVVGERLSPPVQEDEHRPAPRAAGGDDRVHVEVLPDGTAVDGQVDHACPMAVGGRQHGGAEGQKAGGQQQPVLWSFVAGLARKAVYPLRRWPRLTRGVLAAAAGGAILVGLANAYVLLEAGRSSDRVDDLPHAQAAIVPGALVNPDGTMSTMLADRVDGALSLWRAGKVDRILVSGDHRSWAYDEPDTMREALVRAGVPGRDVFEDHAGVDTWATMQRARAIFHVRDAIVVTQGFHMPRALYLANAAGIDAVGLTSDLHPYGVQGVKSDVREVLSRTKAVLDTALATPAMAGPPIPIGGDGRASWGPPPPPGTPPAGAPRH
jgi:SanA protein